MCFRRASNDTGAWSWTLPPVQAVHLTVISLMPSSRKATMPQTGTVPQPRVEYRVKGSSVSHMTMNREVCLQGSETMRIQGLGWPGQAQTPQQPVVRVVVRATDRVGTKSLLWSLARSLQDA